MRRMRGLLSKACQGPIDKVETAMTSSTPPYRFLKKLCRLGLILSAALALGWLLAATPFGARVDGLFLDGVMPLLGAPRETPGMVVILINEKDYAKARTPFALWGTRLAPLLERLRKARPRAVGLDLILPAFPLDRFLPNHDQDMYRALARMARAVTLVSGYAISPDGSIKGPSLIYQRILGLKGYGFFNLTPDPDGVLRRQRLSLPGGHGKSLVSFAALVAGASPRPGAVITPDWRNPARFATLSFDQAMTAAPGVFAGRTVLVGVDFTFEDRHRTPAAPRGEAGAIFHARVVEALLSGRALADPGRPLSGLIPALLVSLAALWLCARPAPLRVATAGISLALGLGALAAAGLAMGIVLRPALGWAALAVVCGVRLAGGYLEVKEVFGRHVSRRVRDAIIRGRIPTDGETREVSCLFADLRDFTPLTESSPPQEVVAVINAYFQAMSREIRANRGLVLQYVGDEIYAVFGAPDTLEDHARWAVRAARAMSRRLRDLNRELAARGRPTLKHGIGVHSGKVLAGYVGGGDRVSYALVGDTVNLASRLQGLNKELGTEIIISGKTAELAPEEAAYRALPTVPIKGKTEPVSIATIAEDGGE